MHVSPDLTTTQRRHARHGWAKRPKYSIAASPAHGGRSTAQLRSSSPARITARLVLPPSSHSPPRLFSGVPRRQRALRGPFPISTTRCRRRPRSAAVAPLTCRLRPAQPDIASRPARPVSLEFRGRSVPPTA